jgi:hypothetical protein
MIAEVLEQEQVQVQEQEQPPPPLPFTPPPFDSSLVEDTPPSPPPSFSPQSTFGTSGVSVTSANTPTSPVYPTTPPSSPAFNSPPAAPALLNVFGVDAQDAQSTIDSAWDSVFKTIGHAQQHLSMWSDALSEDQYTILLFSIGATAAVCLGVYLIRSANVGVDSGSSILPATYQAADFANLSSSVINPPI